MIVIYSKYSDNPEFNRHDPHQIRIHRNPRLPYRHGTGRNTAGPTDSAWPPGGILNLYQDVLLGMEFIHLGQFLKKLPEDLSSESLFKSIDVIRMVTDKKKFNQIFTLHCTEIK
ncbi:TBC1 domain family member 12 [Nymphon striatum]|nr:TBC1 domain family member 12 [Nymphon striatum]